MTTKTVGENGFRWFIGTVVDRKSDPQKLGRVKVRIYAMHDDSATTPDNELPWATIISPPQSASANQVGITPLGIMEGSTVVGFFADGAEGQLPMILGTIAGIPDSDNSKHDVAKLAREENDLLNIKNEKRVQGDLVTEPSTPYNAKYPYNKVLRTERGHIVEVDDTEEQERLHIYHRTGTYTEIDKDGNRVDKIVGEGFDITVKNKNVYVGGDCTVEIDGSALVNIKNNCELTVGGECNMYSGGIMRIRSGSRIIMSAPRIDLNPDSISTSSSDNTTAIIPAPTNSNRSKYSGFVQPNVTRAPWGT